MLVRRLVLVVLSSVLVAASFALPVAAGAEGSCPNEQLRSENASSRLPDCRAYELVSPADKSDGTGNVLAFEYFAQTPSPMQATIDGGAATYSGEAFGQPKSGGLDQYVSTRQSSDWSTANVTPPRQRKEITAALIGVSTDLSQSLVATVQAIQLSTDAPARYRNLYLQDNQTGSLIPMITHQPPNRTAEQFGEARRGRGEQILIAPSSDDQTRIFFAANDALTANAGDGGEGENNLYRWTAGQLKLVNILPDGATEPNASFGFEYESGVVENEPTPNLDHAISSDGLRAFWTNYNDNNLYLRESYFEGGEEKERTVQVDDAVGGGGRFLGASSNGAKVFFAKNEELYRYDVDSKQLVDLTPSPSAALQGVVGASDDGEYIYFVANGALATGALPGNCTELSSPGATCSLYLWHGGATRFIATLSNEDNQPGISVADGGSRVADWVPTIGQRAAEASPSGQFVAFGSHLPLTGQSNAGPEIFVYDAATNALSCPSCSPNKASNAGAFLPPFADSRSTHHQRYMLDNGRLFFTTTAGLVPRDNNGQKDVYEWEGGEAHLISSGTSDRRSVFADTSENGSDVFFTTSQALIPQDQDEITDLYDAKEGGGFPQPPVANLCATTDSCHGALPAGPAFDALPSTTFSGVGNLTPSAPVKPPKTAAQIKAEKLARTLKACRAKHNKHRRRVCESQARKKYGSKTRAKAKSNGGRAK